MRKSPKASKSKSNSGKKRKRRDHRCLLLRSYADPRHLYCAAALLAAFNCVRYRPCV